MRLVALGLMEKHDVVMEMVNLDLDHCLFREMSMKILSL